MESGEVSVRFDFRLISRKHVRDASSPQYPAAKATSDMKSSARPSV